MKMQPKELEQSPQKPFNHQPQKVEVKPKEPINDSINLIDLIRLGFRKVIENKVFSQLQVNSGEAVKAGGYGIGGGLFASVDWAGIATGNILEIIKLILSVACALVGWFWKK